MHDDRIEDRRAVFAERLNVEEDGPERRRVLLDDQEAGRVVFVEDTELDGGFGWVVEYWTGSEWEQSLDGLLAERDQLEEADRHGVERIATLLAEGVAHLKADA